MADPQVVVLAMRLKGEDTCAPLAGVETVMADAGTLIPKSANTAERRVFINIPRVNGCRSKHQVERNCMDQLRSLRNAALSKLPAGVDLHDRTNLQTGASTNFVNEDLRA